MLLETAVIDISTAVNLQKKEPREDTAIGPRSRVPWQLHAHCRLSTISNLFTEITAPTAVRGTIRYSHRY